MATRSGIGEILVSSRSLAEYRAMFALTDIDLQRAILDCPGGAASAVAEINARGGDATASDPAYEQFDAHDLGEMSLAETRRGNEYVRAHPDEYVWTFFADADEHLRSRTEAGSMFAADRSAHPLRYVPGALPELPFAAGAFDLVLSSHFLFSYADRFDNAFHRSAVRELMRVARTELRIFPLIAMGATAYPHIDSLRTGLADDGIGTEVVAVEYEFQRGGNQMLVCRHVQEEIGRQTPSSSA
jgi:SAM-dependent methyltransferase